MVARVAASSGAQSVMTRMRGCVGPALCISGGVRVVRAICIWRDFLSSVIFMCERPCKMDDPVKNR